MQQCRDKEIQQKHKNVKVHEYENVKVQKAKHTPNNKNAKKLQEASL